MTILFFTRHKTNELTKVYPRYTIHNMKRIVYFITKYTVLTLAAIILATQLSTTVYAMTESDKETFKKEIIAASELLQKAIQNSKEKAEDQLKQKIASEELDYQLTMMSYGNQPDPYSKCDYNKLIFAYATAKEYSNSMETLYNLPFYQIDFDKAEVEEYIPKLIQTYIEDDNGYYTLGNKVYIDEPTEVMLARKVSGIDNRYEKTGTKIVTPELKKTAYGSVKVKGLEPDDIFKYFGLSNNNVVINQYKKKIAQAESIISGIGLSEVYNIKIPSVIKLSEEIKEYLRTLLNNEDIEYNRRQLIAVAKALIGKVPYEWGGKCEKSGYDTAWWTINSNGQQKGLDCSGFVQWAFRTAGFEEWKKLTGTSSILENTKTIAKTDLRPGDLGLLNNGQTINHVGIYLGDDYWIHCSSTYDTVIVEKTDMFTIFKEMPGLYDEVVVEAESGEIESPEYYVETENQENGAWTEEDIYLLAQLISHEAHTEGFNGWIAVAEVVRNRIYSDNFPSTIREVIYERDQFAHSDEIKDVTPTEEEIEVARSVLYGHLEILGNKNVLFFRNAKGSKDDWGEYKWFREINHHEFYLGKN